MTIFMTLPLSTITRHLCPLTALPLFQKMLQQLVVEFTA